MKGPSLEIVQTRPLRIEDGNDFFVDCGQGFVAKVELRDCAPDGFEPDQHVRANVLMEGSYLV